VPNEYVSFGGLGERVQTFTAGKTGTVESVYLYLKREQAEGYDLSYGIGPTDENGQPDGLRTGDTILASAIPERGGWVKLPIDDVPYTTQVTAGEQYYLYVFTTCGGVCTGGAIYAGATGDSYARGTSLYTGEPDYSNWVDQHTDWAFRTYVTPPLNTFITGGPSGFVSDTSPTFTFSANRPNSAFMCSLDGPTFRSCFSPKTHTGLRDGRHVFRVLADSAGDTDPTPGVWRWTVDTTAPLITDVRPLQGSSIKDRTPTTSATIRDAQLDLAKENIKVFVDGRQTLAFKYNRDTNRLSYTPSRYLSYDKHTIRIRAEDAVGLVASKSWSFKVVR
jgi:hypothetical protein